MNRADIVETVADAIGLTRAEVSAVFESALKLIEQDLARGGTVELRRFGTFKCVQRAARQAVNPRTGQPVKVPARVIPTFKPSPKLRNAVKNVKF
jgi:nucleoid DNA-binding protein